MADMSKRVVSLLKATSPEELTLELAKVNMRTGRSTEVISIHKEAPFWLAFYYSYGVGLPENPTTPVKKKRSKKRVS